MNHKSPKSKIEQDIILLEDLAPPVEVRGGTNYLLFGERTVMERSNQDKQQNENLLNHSPNGENHEDQS